jgi:hypothetical protein
LTDAVEKVGSKSRMRNNRIEEACCSNQSCANYWFLESKLPCGTLKIFFQQYRPQAEVAGERIRRTDCEIPSERIGLTPA